MLLRPGPDLEFSQGILRFSAACAVLGVYLHAAQRNLRREQSGSKGRLQNAEMQASMGS